MRCVLVHNVALLKGAGRRLPVHIKTFIVSLRVTPALQAQIGKGCGLLLRYTSGQTVWQACLWLTAPVLSMHRCSLFQLLSLRAQAHLAGRLQDGLPGAVWQLLHHSWGTPHMCSHLCRVHSDQLPAQVAWALSVSNSGSSLAAGAGCTVTSCRHTPSQVTWKGHCPSQAGSSSAAEMHHQACRWCIRGPLRTGRTLLAVLLANQSGSTLFLALGLGRGPIGCRCQDLLQS